MVYRDSEGRFADDPAYTGRRYDGDHAPDELLRQVLDVTLVDWIVFLETLRTTWPAMFDAVWQRDAVEVKQLLGNKPRLPVMDFLRVKKKEQDRFCTLVAIFWEAERCFELMHAFGGPRRVTKPKLLVAMRSTSTLGAEIAADGARPDTSQRLGATAGRCPCCSKTVSRSVTIPAIRIAR